MGQFRKYALEGHSDLLLPTSAYMDSDLERTETSAKLRCPNAPLSTRNTKASLCNPRRSDGCKGAAICAALKWHSWSRFNPSYNNF